MGHITVERLESSWKKLNKSEHLLENDQTYGAVLACENALEELHRSASGMGFAVWFTGKEDSVRNELSQLKIETDPNTQKTQQVIDQCRELTKETESKVIPELHDRIDYTPTPTFRDK